jgi:hypothetical protein
MSNSSRWRDLIHWLHNLDPLEVDDFDYGMVMNKIMEIKQRNAVRDTPKSSLEVGSGHTGPCQVGCQCDLAKMSKVAQNEDDMKEYVTKPLLTKIKSLEEKLKQAEDSMKLRFGMSLCPVCGRGAPSGSLCHRCLEDKLKRAEAALEHIAKNGCNGDEVIATNYFEKGDPR